MTAALVAEALAAAERETPETGPEWLGLGSSEWFSWRSIDVQAEGRGKSFFGADEGNYVRRDVMDAALRHLAERVEKAEAALADEREAIRRVAREHWLRVAREKVNAMEYDLQSIRRGHGTVGFYTKGVPQRELRRPSARARIDAAIATDERAKREFPGLIAKTTASIQEAEREIAAENAVGFHVFGGKAPRG